MTKFEAIKQAEEIKYRAQTMMVDARSIDDIKELSRMVRTAEQTIRELRAGEHC